VVAGVSGVSKVTTMQDAVREFVHDRDTVAIEGFTPLIFLPAGQEILRQKPRRLQQPHQRAARALGPRRGIDDQ